MNKREIKKNKPNGASSYAYIYGVLEYFKVVDNKVMIFESGCWIPFKRTTHETSTGTKFVEI